MLRSALGPAIAAWLEDPTIAEIMLNPDGKLWIDRLSGDMEDSGCTMTAADGERILYTIAHYVGAEVTPKSPCLSAELPETGERFEGLIPPVVAAPTFSIRKPAVAVFTIDDYVAARIMTAEQAEFLRHAVAQHSNILVAGGTSTGKTTLVNALLAEVAKSADRVVIIEDTRELQCRAPNLVALRTQKDVASISDLVRSSLRLRPDRIPIGEVRGGAEALDLVKAGGTGHPGGIGTIHAGSAIGALQRIEQLIQEVVVTVPRPLIAETINVIAVLAGRGIKRRLVELATVKGLEASGDYILVPVLQTKRQGWPLTALVTSTGRTEIAIGMRTNEAMALAELVKRLNREDCARFAAPNVTYNGVPEADTIWSSVRALQYALAEAGFAPR
jgi:type IV secretion system protein VirB11